MSIRARHLIAGAVLALTILQAGTAIAQSPSAGSLGTVQFGVDLPLQGSSLAATQPILNGFILAVEEANAANAAGGYAVELLVRDDTVQGNPDAQQGANNALEFAQNPNVVAMLGPYNSGIARSQIPVTNEVGLLQCSPSNTNEGLTKPQYGALELRPVNPERIAYVRTVTADDIIAPASARYAYNTLGRTHALVVDDTGDAADAADRFETEFQGLGGTTIREGVPRSVGDYRSILNAAKAAGIDATYFAGVTATGGGLLRNQMGALDMVDVPFLSGDGILDGSATTESSFNNIAGEAADNSFSAVAAITEIPEREAFYSRYQERFGTEASAYSATAYACVQVALEALRNAQATDLPGLREAVRAYATDPANSFDTVLGTVSFDENGDTTQRVVSVFESIDGEWVFREQQEYE